MSGAHTEELQDDSSRAEEAAVYEAPAVLRLLWAFLTVIVGVWLIVEPHNGTLTLTLVLGLYFLFMGITRIAVAFASRGQQNAGQQSTSTHGDPPHLVPGFVIRWPRRTYNVLPPPHSLVTAFM